MREREREKKSAFQISNCAHNNLHLIAKTFNLHSIYRALFIPRQISIEIRWHCHLFALRHIEEINCRHVNWQRHQRRIVSVYSEQRPCRDKGGLEITRSLPAALLLDVTNAPDGRFHDSGVFENRNETLFMPNFYARAVPSKESNVSSSPASCKTLSLFLSFDTWPLLMRLQ